MGPVEIPMGRLVLYVTKSSPTSTANSIKPLMLLEELSIEHYIQVVQSPTREEWFHEINPHKMVPAMEDVEVRNGKRLNIWESSSCLTFLADKYDTDGLFKGRDLWERTQVGNWLTFHTTALGATAKWWLMFKFKNLDNMEPTYDMFVTDIKKQYTILEKRLSEPGQEWIALPDRPTIADIATLPFANAQIAATADIDFEWPKLAAWSERMYARPAVQRAYKRITKFGHE